MVPYPLPSPFLPSLASPARPQEGKERGPSPCRLGLAWRCRNAAQHELHTTTITSKRKKRRTDIHMQLEHLKIEHPLFAHIGTLLKEAPAWFIPS
ncbi:hypothetical protein BaRGS_00005823 [Batillaria attramentaria]|uniref:Uncharacterized protein n=1 Tax=Batillaria attramentaria TaxID=370345 RepID=A0ABD0LTH2_9CAEN